MVDIEIKRGYEVLPDNNVRFGVRVINNSDSAISDVEVILDYTESLFESEGDKIQKLGNIPPTVPRTAKFILKPLGCIHKEEIGATVRYKDHQWKKHVEQMRPKEVHCVCPFLKEKAMKQTEFFNLSKSGYSAEQGVNFENINVDRMASFLSQTCRNRLYKVGEYAIENGIILYLASEAIGEKAYYLLTAVIKEYEGLTQIMLRANSDKRHGLNGFLNEILDNLRHVVETVHSAREIGIIKKEQVINIIDSVVQRTTFSVGKEAASVSIRGSVVQRTEIRESEEENKQEKEKLHIQKAEEILKRQEQEEQERTAREREKLTRKEPSGTSWKGFFAVALVLGAALLFVYLMFMTGANNEPTPSLMPTPIPTSAPGPNNSIGMEFVLIPAGEFDMGSPESEKYRDSDEGPVHRIKIANTFYMGKYEVTQKQWRDVMGNNPSYFKGDDLPVEQVSWDDVKEFIRKLNEKESTNKYRLPSEAEWEYAARAGTTTEYSFEYDQFNQYVWYYDNSGSKTHEVGQKKPNRWGLYDIHGNVWEWVQDEAHDNYNGAPNDGSAWERDGYNRVNRGGSWSLDEWYLRSALRRDHAPGNRYSDLGFRLVKDV